MTFKFDRTMIDFVKQFPGTRWDSADRAWLIPEELEKDIYEFATSRGAAIQSHYHQREQRDPAPFDPRLHEFQRSAATRANAMGCQLAAFQTGLGKSGTAISAARMVDAGRILVITQRGVLGHWGVEVAKWWPDGVERFTVTNYEQLAKLEGEKFDYFILDEIQNVKNWQTARYKACDKLLKNNPDAIRFALSATPVDKPEETYALFSLLIPGIFGWWTKFRDRYCETSNDLINDRDITRVEGISKLHGEELRRRIEHYTVCASQLEHAHLLQPFSVRPLRISRQGDVESLGVGATALGDDVDWIESLKSERDVKLAAVLEWAKAQFLAGQRKLMIVTYRVELAEEIKRAIEPREDGLSVCLVTGATKNKDEVILNAANAEDGVLVASMKSIGVGVDCLKAFPKTLVVELHWSISLMKQLLGRFRRLGGLIPTEVDLMVVDGTMSAVIADRLVKKLSAVGTLFASDTTDTAIQQTLNPDVDDEEFLAELRAACAGEMKEDWE
jgi:hypothetical protein